MAATSSKEFATTQRGASLMLAFRMEAKLTVIVGSNRLAASRAFSALEADSAVIVLARGGFNSACEELKWRSQSGELEIFDFEDFVGPSESPQDRELAAFESFLNSQSPVALVCVADTLLSSDAPYRRSRASAAEIARICRERNIPVNVTDIPTLCDFTFSATHRFTDPTTDTATPLQVSITTNGQGCRLAGRIKREVVAKLPPDVGLAVKKVGRLRTLAKERATSSTAEEEHESAENELNEEMTVSSPNRPVPQRALEVDSEESDLERTRRRMKWVAQISEYWSIAQLANLTDSSMSAMLSGDLTDASKNAADTRLSSQHSLDLVPASQNQGRVLLVGSGPGHPSLLTLAAHAALTREADLVLTDKLVPAGVLALIPKHVEVRVARKFPGNAEGAQQEMMDMALTAARAGKTVVRLKQGDPALYGRVGEELLFLRAHGISTLIIPGISSALAAPLFAHIPVTQRGAAESLIVCTGVGRQGRDVCLPGYVRERTLVVLMGVARLPAIADALLELQSEATGTKTKRRDGAAYPPYLPAAIIERASMPDQRVVASTLGDLVAALENTGEQRPPGMLVVGWAVLALYGKGDTTVLSSEAGEVDDLRRVDRWLEGRRWRVSEGLDPLWGAFEVSSTP